MTRNTLPPCRSAVRFSLVEQVRERRSPYSEYRVDISAAYRRDKVVDIYVAPVSEDRFGRHLQERSMADKTTAR